MLAYLCLENTFSPLPTQPAKLLVNIHQQKHLLFTGLLSICKTTAKANQECVVVEDWRILMMFS